jgi:hypothetical protein
MTTTQMNAQQLSAEPKPDAPLTRLWRLVLELGSAAMMVGIGLLLLAYLMPGLLPRNRAEECEVLVVAQTLLELTAPADGWCEPVTPLQHGERITKGQPLIRFESPELLAQLAAKKRRLDKLLERKLLLDEIAGEFDPASSSYESQREFRQVILDIADTKSDVERLEEILSKNVISSPTDGRIHFGLAASQAVKAHDPIAHIFPDSGVLLLEVKGPLTLIKQLLARNQVKAVIQTANDKVSVVARPNAATLRTFSQSEKNGKALELCGVVQCSLESTSGIVLTPGIHGVLDE